MQISAEPKDLIIVRAATVSTWDITNCAIIDLMRLDHQNIKDWLNVLSSIKETSLFSSFCVSLSIGDFFHLNTVNGLEFNIDEWIPEDSPWAYFQINNNEYSQIGRPDNRLQYWEMIFCTDSFYMGAYGKHTGEHFWTDAIPISVLEDYIRRDQTPLLQ